MGARARNVLALLSLAVQVEDPRTVGSHFTPGAEAVWVFDAAGERIGHHASRYVGIDDAAGVRAHHFQGSYRLKGAVEVLSTADLWTDDRGHPIRFAQQALVGDSYSRVELEVAGTGCKAHVVQGASPRDLELPIDPSAYLLANNFISHLELLLALQPPGESAKLKLFSGSTLQGLDFVLTAVGPFETTIDGVPAKGSEYRDSLGEHIRFAGGRIVEIEVPAAKLVIRRTDKRVELVRIVPPEIRRSAASFDVEEVRIEHDGVVLGGAVTKRKGAQGRLPAVFFVSGSGPQDRDGFSSGVDLGTHEILDHLTNQGFLVLRADDRGTGASSPLPDDLRFPDLVADARACLAHLEQRDDVDPERIVVIGHSEGAATAPVLAVERPEIAAIVLMAPPGRGILEIVADQNRRELVQRGLSPDDVEQQMEEIRAFLARLASDEPIDPEQLSADERPALAGRAWFQSHAKHDPIATIREVECPVLILHGAKDFQVSPEKDAQALERALEAANHPDHELHVLAGLDHLFKKSPGETSELADYWKTRPVDPSFFAALDAWLAPRLKPGGG